MNFVIKKLFTKDDPLHIHKVLGGFCLGNFIYRYTMLFRYGDMFLQNGGGDFYSITWSS